MPGVYIQKADEIRYKEERKIIAGYSSGRKAPEVRRLTTKKKIEFYKLFFKCVGQYFARNSLLISVYWIGL